ncbi:tape measure protein [Nocardioides sp. GY 10127]|uniref:tape measure protein n=1 Tax=Nocardioides sp. GY 10127 TaxID=2569762 RepID=UPI0010A9120F|nr:tape measure protein [Nocardioides sp. GY 10127]TIC78776.1 hypothetical protein E8D37_18950 [Nocardioides sp. GY 10127]
MATEEIGLKFTLYGRREAASALTGVRKGLDEVSDSGDDAAASLERASDGKISRGFAAISRGAASLAGTLARGLVLGAAAGTTALVGVAAAAATIGIKTASSMQQAKIGFTTMLGSAKKASTFLRSLAKFAARTPFEFTDLQTAASSLVSVGIETDKVIPIMTTLGNVTAGMGTGSEGIQRATVALQQMTAAQKISGEDLNQLRDAGVPVYDLLAAALGKTKGEVVQLASAGKLGKKALDAMMHALETGQGLERFNGLMDKQSQSLAGMWSTLSDTVTMGLARAFKPAVPLLTDLTGEAAKLVQKGIKPLKQWVAAAADEGQRLFDAYKTGGIDAALDQMSGPLKTVATWARNLAVNFDGFHWPSSQGASDLGASLGQLGDALGRVDWSALGDGTAKTASDTVSVFAVAVGFAADHVDTLAKYLPVLVAAFAAYKTAQALANAVKLAEVPITVAQVAANLALARSNTRLAGQLAATTGATVAQTAAGKASVAGMIAGKVAALAAAAATKVAAAGQWLLNAALTANPIGLVIAGVALLIGGLVLAYKKSETFRNIVNGAFGAVLAVVKTVWGWIKDNWKTLLAVLVGPIGIAVLVIAKNWDKIKSGAAAVKDWIVDKFLALVTFYATMPARVARVAGGMFNGIKDAFKSAINWIIEKWNALSFSIPSIDTHIPGVGQVGGFTLSTPDIPMLRLGGDVTTGKSYIVGDGGVPELFVPSTSGHVYPSVDAGLKAITAGSPSTEQTAKSMPRSEDDGTRIATPPAQPLEIPLFIDSREIARAVIDDVNTQLARA